MSDFLSSNAPCLAYVNRNPDAQLGRVAKGIEEETSPALFRKPKKCPDFGKRGAKFVHSWVKSSIQKCNFKST